ncbi:MAG: DALR anticodon-binding domain-containing protein, partial [Candidatus Aminicenantales bacterium]
NSMIVFDVDDALSFEGETGPYLMYTVVRLNSIFRKLEEREGTTRAEIEARAAAGRFSFDVLPVSERNELWDLIVTASRFEEEVLHSLSSLEFSRLAKFAFLLCQKVNAYYHQSPVLAEENPDIKNVRALGLFYGRGVLENALNLMGLSVPERM